MDKEYQDAAMAALQRRLDLLDDAKRRGVHTEEEYKRLKLAITKEQLEIWAIKGE